MFILRSVTKNDLNDLMELSQMVFFINLPNDSEIIENKISNSIKSFTNPDKDLCNNTYLFVIEDTTTNKIIGVSMIHAQHGTPVEPHFYLKVTQEHKYCQSLNTGFIHGTLKLGLDTDGPTEIGALVIDPSYRGHQQKLGKQLSFVRFLYMARNPSQFRKTVLSELMPPLDRDGNSPLWEAIGRRFMNMDYIEADKLSRSNKEFITSLYPSENIYQTLLPLEARNAIGQVGKDTIPVKNMLEKIGFKYAAEVDPFDGGPHYKCALNDISIVKNYAESNSWEFTNDQNKLFDQYIVTFEHPEHIFFAVTLNGNMDKDGKLWLERPKEEIGLNEKKIIGHTKIN